MMIQPDATNMPLPNTTADSRIVSIHSSEHLKRTGILWTMNANTQCATAPSPPPRPQIMDMGRKRATYLAEQAFA